MPATSAPTISSAWFYAVQILARLISCSCRVRESVLFIGTQVSNLYTAVDTPAMGRVVVSTVWRQPGCVRDFGIWGSNPAVFMHSRIWTRLIRCTGLNKFLNPPVVVLLLFLQKQNL